MKKEITIENILNKRRKNNRKFSNIILIIIFAIGIIASAIWILIMKASQKHLINISIEQRAKIIMALLSICIPLFVLCSALYIVFLWFKRHRVRRGKEYEIKIATASVVERRIETEIGLTNNALNRYKYRYITFEIDMNSPYNIADSKIFEVGLGFDCYTKLRDGDTVYIIIIDNEIYEDCIFNVNKYYLNSKLKNSVIEPIKIYY